MIFSISGGRLRRSRQSKGGGEQEESTAKRRWLQACALSPSFMSRRSASLKGIVASAHLDLARE